MARHEYDPRVTDYTWKQNRLSKDKEALKNAMLSVIRKKPKKTAGGGNNGAAGGAAAGDSKNAGGANDN